MAMRKDFEPDRLDDPPIMRRLENGTVVALTEYERVNDGKSVVPIYGIDVTDAYDELRSKDSRNGVPLADGSVKIASVGEVAYAAAANLHGWTISWAELDRSDQDSWSVIGHAVKELLEKGTSTFVY